MLSRVLWPGESPGEMHPRSPRKQAKLSRMECLRMLRKVPRILALVAVIYSLQLLLVADPFCWSDRDSSCIGSIMMPSSIRSRKQIVKIQSDVYPSNLSELGHGGEVHVFEGGITTAANQTLTMTSKRKPPPPSPPTTPTITSQEKNSFNGIAARIFPPWTQEAIPCLPAESTWNKYDTQMTPTKDGFLFLKTFKTGSSTASGVHLRMARNIANRRNISSPICKARFDHVWANKMYTQLDRRQSFLWTILREPTSRAVSQLFHFHVSRENHTSTDESLIGRIRSDSVMYYQYYMKSLSMTGFKPKDSNTDPIRVANEIMRQYDFIAVTERMDESLVALSMLLHLPLADVLYLKAKGNGGYDDGGHGFCVMIQKSFVSDGMKDFFQSPEFHEKVHWDELLYQAANRSLDLTIDSLGRPEFEVKLSLFRKALKDATEQCLASTRFPCTDKGFMRKKSDTDCLWKDSGCGSDCLDSVASEFNLWQ